MAKKNEIISLDSDVLIIGGGLAGCMAAIKASEFGVTVMLTCGPTSRLSTKKWVTRLKT
jgi:succinate dehydrogenase/fumarate reductase flavoprotein subunit